MDQLTVVIVTYHSEECIGRCVDAALRWTPHVMVVDNASTDKTVEFARLHGASVIANTDNRGFAGAANQGFSAASTPYVLLLNPDVTLFEGRDALMKSAGMGASTGMLTDEAGNPQAGFTIRRLPSARTLAFESLGLNRIFPANPVNRHWRALDLDFTVSQSVEQPPGAFLMVNRQAWEEIGGLDESFWPIWFEDVDFCKRLLDAGFRITYTPDAKASHVGAHSIRQLPRGEREVQWYVSLLRYAEKHFGLAAHVFVAASVALSSIPRAVVGLFRSDGGKPLEVCSEILKQARESVMKRFRSSGKLSRVTAQTTVRNSAEEHKTHIHVP